MSRLTPNAANGLANIVHYIDGAFSMNTANKFLGDFDEILFLIKTQPMMFPVSKTSKRVRLALVNKLTFIYFLIEEDTITVVAIEDNRKQPPKF